METLSLLLLLVVVCCISRGTSDLLGDSLSVWDLESWNSTSGGRQCHRQVERYLRASSTGLPWANRMSDASGRYSGGLSSGDQFWLGSKAACQLLHQQTPGNRSDYLPPYPVGFFVVKLGLNITVRGLQGVREFVVGLCLPRACSEDDVRMLLERSEDIATPSERGRLETRSVRFLSEEYSYWRDPKFYVMLAVTLLTGVLMVVGTVLDAWKHDDSSCRASETGNNNHDPEVATRHKLRTVGPRTSSRGSCYELSGADKIIPEEHFTIGTSQFDASFKEKFSEDVNQVGLLSRVLLCFSVIRNSRKLCSLSVTKDNLAPVHGLRFFSLMWIILLHTCLVLFQVSDNKNFRTEAEKDVLYQTLSNGTYSVDTFFFISGLLVSFLFFRSAVEHSTRTIKEQVMQFFNMIVYRLFRLSPPYLYVLGIVALTAKWFRDHTVTEMPAMDHVNCDKYWWRNALYINTFFTFKERCMGWSWYLSNDTQFYVVGVTILMIAVKHFWLAASTLVVFMLGAWTTTALVTISTNHRPSIQEPFAQYDELYDKPWTRIGPYLVGMSVGYLLYRSNCAISINKYVVLLGWTLALTCTSCVVYGLYYVELTPVTSAAYVSLSHTVWACAMAWILVACCTGHGGFVNAVLSWRYLFPLSRLSYCAYLVHPVLMRSAVLNYDSSIHITRDIVFIWYFGFVLSSYAVAFLLSLAFEAPVISIFKMADSPRRS